MHHLHVGLSMAQCLQRSLLGGGARTHDGILVHLKHGLQDEGRSSDIANAPAGHGIRFREAIQQNRTLLHTRKRGNADMFRAVDQAAVDFVARNNQVVLYG